MTASLPTALEAELVDRVAVAIERCYAEAEGNFALIAPHLHTLLEGAWSREATVADGSQVLTWAARFNESVRDHLDAMFAGEFILWWDGWIRRHGRQDP